MNSANVPSYCTHTRTYKEEAFLDHFLTVKIGDEYVAIGEAGGLESLGPDSWEAWIGQWGRDLITHQIVPQMFVGGGRRVIEGPFYRLVPKTEFQGRLIS